MHVATADLLDLVETLLATCVHLPDLPRLMLVSSQSTFAVAFEQPVVTEPLHPDLVLDMSLQSVPDAVECALARSLPGYRWNLSLHHQLSIFDLTART